MTVAGWIHGLYAVIALWIIALVYLTVPHVPKADLIKMSIALTPFFFIGVVKWNMRWFTNLPNDKMAIIQSIGGPAIVWTVTMVRIKWSL